MRGYDPMASAERVTSSIVNLLSSQPVEGSLLNAKMPFKTQNSVARGLFLEKLDSLASACQKTKIYNEVVAKLKNAELRARVRGHFDNCSATTAFVSQKKNWSFAETAEVCAAMDQTKANFLAYTSLLDRFNSAGICDCGSAEKNFARAFEAGKKTDDFAMLLLTLVPGAPTAAVAPKTRQKIFEVVADSLLEKPAPAPAPAPVPPRRIEPTPPPRPEPPQLNPKLQQLDSAKNLLLGAAVPQNFPEALRLFRTVDTPEAWTVLGKMHLHGLGVQKSSAEAKELFARAAAAGSTVAGVELGKLVEREAVVERKGGLERRGVVDDILAMERDVPITEYPINKQRGEKNRDMPLSDYPINKQRGGVNLPSPKDRASASRMAASYYRAAAEQGDAEGQCCLGYSLESGALGLPDAATAAGLYAQAAASGHPRAQHNLAALYLRGAAAEPRQGAALSLLKRSAAAGFARSFVDLGRCYLRGRGVEKDPRVAEEFFEKAAGYDDPYAQFYLGFCALRRGGAGEEAAFAEADQLFRNALCYNVPQAETLFYLGLMAEKGLGRPSDRAEAVRFFARSAAEESRPSKAAARLGALLLEGKPPLPANPARARLLFDLAANADSSAAANVRSLQASGVRAEDNEELKRLLLLPNANPADLLRALGADFSSKPDFSASLKSTLRFPGKENSVYLARGENWDDFVPVPDETKMTGMAYEFFEEDRGYRALFLNQV